MESRTDQESARRCVLVVDGDEQTQRILDLSLRNAGFEVRTVTTGDEALASIADQEPDLVVSETRLTPGVDGFELCRRIKQRPDRAPIPFLFLSQLTVENKVRGIEAGADDFLGKPLYLQEVVARARALLQRRERERLEVLAEGNAPFAGDLADIPLVDLLRAVQAHRKSGVAHLHGPGGVRGEIYFRHGAAVDGEVGRLSGREAVYRLLAWSTGRFEIEWKSIRRKDAVEMDPAALLVEGLRRQDEWRRLLVDAPRLDTIFEVDYRLLADRLAEIPDEVNSILRLFDGTRTFLRVVDECGLGDLEALGVIGKLYRESIIRETTGKRDAGEANRGDSDGWSGDPNGPFRAAPDRPRRDLFGAGADQPAGVHGRSTAPVEPLEEAPEPATEETRARFTDRLNTDAPSSGARPPPEVRLVGPHGLTPAQEAALLLSESTLQGFPVPAPPRPVTSPGFATAVPGSAGAKRGLPDVTPPSRTPAGGTASSASPPGTGDGIPEAVAPQDGAPAILIPFPASDAGPSEGPDSETAPIEEQRPVAGEIVARKLPPKGSDSRAAVERLTQLRDTASLPVRGTDPGIGASDAADGEVAPHTESEPSIRLPPARPWPLAGDQGSDSDADAQQAQDYSDDDDVDGTALPARSRGPILISVGVGMIMAFGLGWVLLGSGRRPPGSADQQAQSGQTSPSLQEAPAAALAPTPSAAIPAAEAEQPTPTPTPAAILPGPEPAATNVPRMVPAANTGGPVRAAPAVHSSSASSSPAGSSSRRPTSTPPVSTAAVLDLDERTSDPKVARDAPVQFPQLLTACRAAFGEKRMKDAEAACAAARDANPDSAEACALLAHALFNRNHRREALVWAERSVKIDPNQADAYVIIGGVHQDAGEKTAAKAAYQRYLELAPGGTYAADLRAIVESL